ncbi:MAG: DNA (cytosine-5-)-methyltransferase, partial [Cetobacterium sp.]
SDKISVTKEHPFYVRKKTKEWDSESRKYKRCFDKASWIPVKDLTKEYYVGTAINNESVLPKWSGSVFKWEDGRADRYSNILNDKFKLVDFWWLIGRYIGDGWIRSQGGIIICCDFDETEEIIVKINSVGFNYSVSKERTVNKIHLSFKEIGEFCEQFGRGAKNKTITGDILNLPVDLLEGFLEGYMSADGCFTQGLNKATSISPTLIYSIGHCVAKVYKRPFSVYKTKRPRTCKIEDRIVNQNDTYQITWKNQKSIQDKAFYEDGYIWSPIKKNETFDYDGLVYNIEVEEDNSYVVQNIIVHNCQDLSVAGLGKGIKVGTRSGLLYEVERLLEDSVKPKYLLMENVKNLVGKKNKPDFDIWCEKLTELGYKNYWQVLNAKDYGVPQNRERIFMVSILGK